MSYMHITLLKDDRQAKICEIDHHANVPSFFLFDLYSRLLAYRKLSTHDPLLRKVYVCIRTSHKLAVSKIKKQIVISPKFSSLSPRQYISHLIHP